MHQYMAWDESFADDTDRMFFACGRRAEGQTWSFLRWHDPPHPLELVQALRELWHDKIHHNQ
jgi:hypothetical protein